MARIARVIAAGIPHHITQRGNRRMQTFFEKPRGTLLFIYLLTLFLLMTLSAYAALSKDDRLSSLLSETGVRCHGRFYPTISGKNSAAQPGLMGGGTSWARSRVALNLFAIVLSGISWPRISPAGFSIV